MSILRSVPITLNEEVSKDQSTPVQLLRTCTFYHERYGKVDIAEKLFSEMIENFKNRVRGIDIMIDYEHDSQGPAAGWVKDLYVDGDDKEKRLMAKVDWTPGGAKRLSDKEFRYLSADFDPDYRDNENPEKKFGAVLLGAGLTNRPVIKRMAPAMELSEYKLECKPERQLEEGGAIEEEKMAEDKNKEMQEEMPAPQVDEMKELKDLMTEMGISSIADLVAMVKKMKSGDIEAMESELAELKEEKMLSEKKAKFDKLFQEGKVVEAQREEALKLSEEAFTSWIKLAELNPSIKTKDIGHGNDATQNESDDNRDVEDIIEEKAIALSEEKDIGISEAITMVLSENKDLAEKYNNK